MANGSMHFENPTPLGLAIAQMITAAGKDPNTVFAVFDAVDALAITQERPQMRGERLLIIFQDWSVMNIDLPGSGSPQH